MQQCGGGGTICRKQKAETLRAALRCRVLCLAGCASQHRDWPNIVTDHAIIMWTADRSCAILAVPSLHSTELAHEDAVRDLKQENDKNVTKLRQQYEREVRSARAAQRLDLPAVLLFSPDLPSPPLPSPRVHRSRSCNQNTSSR